MHTRSHRLVNGFTNEYLCSRIAPLGDGANDLFTRQTQAVNRVARGQENAAAAENTEAYLSRAAVNASLDLLRSRKRSKTVAIDDVESGASISALVARQNPETHHEDRELRNLIREAVSKLGDTAGQMFALRYFEGYGNAEIAQMMNTSALVVGVTLHRARTRLRKEIGRYLRS